MEAMAFICSRGKVLYKLQKTEREKLLNRLTCTGDVILKHPGKSITNFPRENYDMSGQLRDRLLAWAVYIEQFILSIQLKLLLSHSNLHFWIPGATAGKALLLCSGCSRMRRAWDEGFTFIFETTSTKVQCLQFFPAGRVLPTGKEGTGRPRPGCRHSCINPVTKDHPVFSPS